MKGPGAKVRSWGFGRLFGLACFVTFSLTPTVPGGAHSKGENLKIIIRVHDYARLRQGTLGSRNHFIVEDKVERMRLWGK